MSKNFRVLNFRVKIFSYNKRSTKISHKIFLAVQRVMEEFEIKELAVFEVTTYTRKYGTLLMAKS